MSSKGGSQMTSRILNAVRRHPIIAFFVLTYAISWGGLLFESVGFLPSGPFLAALIVIPVTQGVAGLKELGLRIIRWRVRWYWYAVALGVPLAVHLAVVGLNVASGAGVPSLTFASLTTFLMVFAIRLINPTDGPLGENPGWQGFALPGLQGSGYSPLVATAIVAPLVSLWHLPLFFWEPGGLQPSVLVGGLVVTMAATIFYNWLFNRTGGSVLLVILAHDLEGNNQYEIGRIRLGEWGVLGGGV